MNQQSVSFFLRVWNLIQVAVISVALSLSQVAAAEINENVLVIKTGEVKELVVDESNEAGEPVGENEKNDGVTTEMPENTSAHEPPELPPFDAEPEQQEASADGIKKTLLIIGAGVAAATALALALGGGGGSDDASSSTPPPEPFDGPDIAGDWTGELDLVIFEPEAVGATITRNGQEIKIHTTASLPYGRNFVGTIDGRGYILVFDQETGEDWTTKEGNATSNSIKLFDWVNTTGELDKLKLHR